MLDIKSWNDAVKLKESKTKFIYFGEKQLLATTHRDTISINGDIIKCTKN